MITEQENQPPVIGRIINLPESINDSPEFILVKTVIEALHKCADCGNVITGTECINCTKQTVL